MQMWCRCGADVAQKCRYRFRDGADVERVQWCTSGAVVQMRCWCRGVAEEVQRCGGAGAGARRFCSYSA